MIEKIAEMLKQKGVILDPLDIESVCKRFGVTQESQIDEDFINIIYSMCDHGGSQNSESPGDGLTADEPPIPRLSDQMQGLKTAIEQKVEFESEKILELYRQVPTKVKNKVISDLVEQTEQEEKDKSIEKFKNVMDFSVVFFQDSVDSRNFLRQVYSVLLLFSIFLLTFSGIVFHESHQTKTEKTSQSR